MRNYGHSEFHGATLQAKIESLLPVERPGDESGGAPEGASDSGGILNDPIGEISAEEAAETIDAAEVLRLEAAKFKAAEDAADDAMEPLSKPGYQDTTISPTWKGRTEDN